MLTKNKHFLYALMGLAGGSLGGLLGNLYYSGKEASFVASVFHVACWFGTCAAPISLGLTWAGEIYRRRPKLAPETIGKSLFSGFLGGAIAGAIAQAVFSTIPVDPTVKEFLLKPACWGIAGLILGLRIATSIPNLGASRAALGGAIGGTLGGYLFLLAGFIAAGLGRTLGIGLTGMGIGLAIVTAEAVLREAYLEVIWGPGETMKVTLGPKPISIGGGDDHVYHPDLRPSTAAVALEDGKIRFTDKTTNAQHDLRDGSQLKIGRLAIVIHAKS